MTLIFSQDESREREREEERRGKWADWTIEHVRHGPINRQESQETRSAFRTAHSISQFKAQHIQLDLFYTPTQVCRSSFITTNWPL